MFHSKREQLDHGVGDSDESGSTFPRILVGDPLDSEMYDSDPLSSPEKSLKERRLKHTTSQKSRHRKEIRRLLQSDRFEETEDDSCSLPTDASSSRDISAVYAELQAISDRLRSETKILHEKELILRDRERRITDAEENINRCAEEEATKKWKLIKQHHAQEMSKMEQILRERTRENKRMKESFDTLKETNDTLRKQLEDLQTEHDTVSKQSSSLQARLTNLQRKKDFASRQDSENLSEIVKLRKITKDTASSKDTSKVVTKIIKPAQGTYDVLAVLLDWVSEVHLRRSITDLPTKPLDSLPSQEFVQERCSKTLPSLVEILRDFPSNNNRIYLPCLQFVYWSLLHLEQGLGSQKVNMASTLRRLGEELYKPKVVRFSEGDLPLSPTRTDKPKEAVFFRSPTLHVRFLSSLVILKSLTQVDHLAHVFDVLRTDLKTDSGKELYHYYQATPVFLPFFRPGKALMGDTVDVYLQMTMESPWMQSFLETCSNERWFQACYMVIRALNQDVKILEKLSIILQKLSKIKGNKKFFEVFTITTTVQELLHKSGYDNSFLTLNLKSILFNLKSEKQDGQRFSGVLNM